MVEPVESRIDPRGSTFVTILGAKGAGKSVLASRLWSTYPFDRLCIDPSGDAQVGEDIDRIGDPLPLRWPAMAEGRSSLRYVPDPGSPSYADDLDRAVGLGFRRGRCLVWVDEIAELTRANRTPPNMRRALHQGRHRRLSLLMCGPRPIDIDPLVISQADLVYVFRTPHPRDKERIAALIGWRPDHFAAAVDGLGPYHYLRWGARDQELVEFPPIPARNITR